MIRKIKILHILPNLSRGGAEKVCQDLLFNTNKEKFSLSLLLFNENGSGEETKKELISQGIEIISLEKDHLIDWTNFLKIIRSIKKIKPDILHCHLGGDIYGRLAGKFCRVPIIISTEHNINHSERPVAKFLKKISAPFATKIFAVSEAVKNDAHKRYGIPLENIEIIHNGIDLSVYTQSNKTLLPPDPTKQIIIGALGRLSEQKGFNVLIEAVSKTINKDYLVKIAGSGELEQKLNSEIKKLNLEKRIKLIGQVETIDFLPTIDILVFPSLWEGLGLAILEAAAMDRPIIASDINSIREVIDNDSAWLFKVGSARELALKIDLVIKNLHSEETNNKTARARKIIIDRFDLKTMISAYERWYELLFEKYAHPASK
jgi:glycosyltransferase involved in cell wall biosynthesis